MGSIYKSSGAEIKAQSANIPFIILQYINPEIVFTKMLREYLLKVDFATMYPKFGNVRVGTVHPFAMLLFQEVLGQKLNTNIFPSVTISDSSDVETEDELARGLEEHILTEESVIALQGHKEAGNLICSDSNMTRLVAAVQGGGKVYAKKFNIKVTHNVDFNIWSDNKDITSLLYDFVKLFIVSHIIALHNTFAVDCNGTISGRRSGDISVEFGKLLYGANITVPCTIQEGVMEVDLTSDIISTIRTQGDYHEGG